MNLGRLTGNRQKKRNVRIILILSNGALKLSSRLDGCEFYLVDISKRSLTELTLHPEAPHLSSSCSQSETDSHQFMWESRRRLLRNCFISGGRVIQRRHVLHIWVSGGARAALMLFGVKTQEQVHYCCTSSAANGKILCFFLVFFKLYTHIGRISLLKQEKTGLTTWNVYKIPWLYFTKGQSTTFGKGNHT